MLVTDFGAQFTKVHSGLQNVTTETTTEEPVLTGTHTVLTASSRDYHGITSHLSHLSLKGELLPNQLIALK